MTIAAKKVLDLVSIIEKFFSAA